MLEAATVKLKQNQGYIRATIHPVSAITLALQSGAKWVLRKVLFRFAWPKARAQGSVSPSRVPIQKQTFTLA
ncbi:hypothetical protein M5M_00090 [Simiduia agarivorans SA1 = DSM 21679]|uniref:Uncharacterized protein n=1 Tax=Simiduia agarivorans (strain DSM 21679 / JCM 13881 / BCRC 17597 / SA1) TaxID=1117647 RepID=K4KTH1_SIMAS|nr:hypothetical protein M5M_00090 [Simiduia agarivorans SA1 = DSM 21679]